MVQITLLHLKKFTITTKIQFKLFKFINNGLPHEEAILLRIRLNSKP